MARRSAKAARKKDAKRQRAAEKRAERARNRTVSPDTASPLAAGRRLLLLRDAVVKGETPAPRGLTNLGNTCFFNAVMQNLARVAPFRDYFVGTPPCPGEGNMTAALRSFFIAMWDINSASVFDPSNLFTEVGKNNPSFKGRAQQDSHELMRVVFDAVIEEEKKRLKNVAKGVLPASLDPDNYDESSESEIAALATEAIPPDHAAPTPAFIGPLPAPKLHSIIGPEPSAPESPPGLPDSDSASVASATAVNGASPEPPSDDTTSDEEIPAEKLITIIERAVGGVLSSTIECKECGTKSSVAEPFLDLQLPLVPRDEPEPKPTMTDTVKDTVKDKASKAASCLKLRRECGPKQEHEQETKATSEETKQKPEASRLVPAAPPPPPPLPAPPKRPESTAATSDGNCDVLRQLRETVVPSEAEPVHESRLILYTGETTMTPNPASDTAAIFDDDDDDSEEYGFLSALFDDDLEDPEELTVSNTTNTNATATGGATQAAASQAPATTPQKKPTVTPPPPRKTSSFISSLFGGLGGVSTAPHGYRSVVGSLEEFTKIEVLEGDNAYGCEECTRREKLRAALQSRRKLKTISKKSSASSNSRVDSTGELDIDDSNLFHSQDAVSTITDIQDCSTLTSQKGIMSEIKAGQGDAEVLMSSPVTSSESSSGVSSEDDGELIIEEELENPPIKNDIVCELSREEEDEIIKQFNVKIPGVRTTAEKRLLIRDAPDVLALQLKRFTQVGYRGGLRKISGHVGYPLNLDMTPFVEQTADNSSASENSRKPDVAKRKRHSFEASDKKANCEYVLTGVVVHGGSLTGGHYTAYVREGMESNSRGGWYFCNDSKISRASEKDVLNSEAYLLYYERVHT